VASYTKKEGGSLRFCYLHDFETPALRDHINDPPLVFLFVDAMLRDIFGLDFPQAYMVKYRPRMYNTSRDNGREVDCDEWWYNYTSGLNDG